MGLPVPAAQADSAVPRKRRKWEAHAKASSQLNTAMYLTEPKDNRYGLGYDPYANAEDFRRARQRRQAEAAGPEHAAGAELAQHKVLT